MSNSIFKDAENQALRAQLLEKETAFVLFFIEIERLFSINQEYDEEVSKLRKKDDVLVEKYNEAVERLNVIELTNFHSNLRNSSPI